jgi:hypothetical protein
MKNQKINCVESTRSGKRSNKKKTHHMYSAMIFSVVSERFRLTRSVRTDMVAALAGKRQKYNTD